MDNGTYALVLTGGLLPGYPAETAWPALAAYFRMDTDKLQQQLLARAPVTIKQSDDLGKLQTLQSGAAAVGAETEICAPDGRPALFVLFDGVPRGPVPRVFADERVRNGLWADSVEVAEVGSNVWRPLRALDAPEPVAAISPPLDADAGPDALPPSPIEMAPTMVASALGAPAVLATQADGGVLPPGAAIHAGFWRRVAAYVIDYVITSVAIWMIALVVGVGIGASQSDPASVASGLVAGQGVLLLSGLVIGWLYFALQESSAAQSTLGKRAMALKVTDDYGRRIGFGRASGRFFGKIISGVILCIGYALAGWTARKQALHDMLAGTLVVFDAVQPGQPLPSVRPPMPWYGWLLNILLVGGIVLAICAGFLFMASIATLVGAAANQGGTGF